MKTLKLFFTILISLLCFFQSNTIKADTIYMTLPGTNMNSCEDTLNFNTFVFYKPFGFGSTIWRINNVIVGSGDSLIFHPTTVGSFQIRATWNGNIEQLLLVLYPAPPPHAAFEIFGGGSINSTKDTVWMCGTSVQVGPGNIVGTDATYDEWNGPSGFYSVGNPVTITIPGTYFYERGNPCGITRDTFEVVSLPTMVPIWHDTAFCNTAVSLTLDAGPGWFTHTWNTGAATQSIYVDTAGTYTVNVSNACTSGSVTIHVEHQTFPAPDLWYLQGGVMCADSVLVLDPSPGYTYDTYLWSNNATTPTISITGGSGGLYQVTVTQGGCTAVAYGSFDFFQEPITPEICIVTVDVSLNKNKVVWTADNEPLPGDPQYAQTASYNVYKAISGFSLIGNVPANQQHTFIDMSSNPPTVSALYKITAVDECGVESSKSWYHKTILLAVTMGANPGEIPLLWNPYQEESGTFTVDMYYLYRGDSPSTLTLLDSVSGYITSYIDTGIYSQKYYQIVVFKSGGCDPAPAFLKGEKTLITGSFSNITNNIITGIPSLSSTIPVTIYPNPSSDGIFHLEGDKVSRVEVMDQVGKIITIIDNSSTTIDLSVFASGVYYARVSNAQGSQVYKLMIQ